MKDHTKPKFQTKAARFLSAGLIGWLTGIVPANALNLSQAPLNLIASQPPLVMMTMARDHKLYYEAYNDYSDLDGDGTLDTYYKPSIEYYGYFDSYKCYNYVSGIFTPVAVTSNKKCTGGNDSYWSGDYLNYLTTARIDALRKVFYGGKRSTDTETQTVLERTFVPQDAHSWGKEYQSVARDGYDIREYTPLSLPANGTRHLFANTTLSSDANPPLLRVLNDSAYRIWEWVSIEKPVAGDKCLHGSTGPNCATTATANTWTIVPSSSTNGLSGLTRTTYNTGAASIPTSRPEFDTFESTYGTTARRCGSGPVSTINGTGNPYQPGSPTTGSCKDNDNYMTIFEGTLNIPADGNYTFGIDGDDAIDLFIDGVPRVDWYGGHGQSGSPPTHTTTVPVFLGAGTHTLKFRHHERTGDDSYRLYWQPAVTASSMADYNVRVEVCKTIAGVDAAQNEGRESNCQGYGSSPVIYKPTGLLHKYGQLNGMYFGLLTGSYDQNTNGGVLRKEVSSIANEVETNTGIFKESGSTCGLSGGTACVKGIVGTINRFKITSYSYTNHNYSCGWIVNQAMTDGQCEMWGNPLGEMVYEGLRYFAGKSSATGSFVTSSTRDDALGLPKVTWGTSTNPYREGAYPSCAKPYFMLVSDVYPSFDSDKIPGTDSNFGTFAGDMSNMAGTALNALDLGENMWKLQFGSTAAKDIFIGQVGATVDNAPTVKSASSFGNIRGLSPSDPTRQGGYATSLMAFYGKTNDLNAATGGQTTSTYSIALAPPLPQIEIKAGANKVVLVPFAKSVGGSAGGGTISPTGTFQPTNQIVDFYVDTINNTTTGNTDSTVNGGRPYYKFRINYEDVEQGADHDMDAIATYEIKLNANDTVTVDLSSDYAAGSIIQHMGYVISGTTADGVYLEVRDKDTDAASDPNYFLDTPQHTGSALPLTSTRTFTASSSASVGTILNDPLWYAAKFGGFNDANNDNIPNDAVTHLDGNGNKVIDVQSEWDADGDGVPDNYYLVVNPLKMLAQMDKALAKIQDDSGTLAMQTSSTRSFSSDTLLFQPAYNSAGWSGELNAYSVTKDSMSAAVWQAQQTLVTKTSGTRVILTYDVDRASDRGIPFAWGSMTGTIATPGTLQTSLNKSANGTVDNLGEDRVDYLRGDVVTGMRTRPTNKGVTTLNKLGDIINSQPQYVPPPNLGYSDTGYAAFKTANASRTKMVYVGANDGMLHGFNAGTGEELLAYVPSEMYRTRGTKQPLSKLTQTDYGQSGNPHRYFVDGTPTMGDICSGSPSCAEDGTDWKTILVGGLNGGGQGIYALDITNPDNFTEAKAATIVKWEFLDHDHDGDSLSSTISGDADLGYTYSRPFIVKLCTARDSTSGSTPKTCLSSKWFVMFGNGYNSTEVDGYAGTGDAVLYVLDADSGFLEKKIALNEADGTDPNGLSELAPIDMDGDGTVDYVYAGDLKGNLWRMDFVSDSKTNWGPTLGTTTNPEPLYIAYDEQTPTRVRQPITTAPDVVAHPVSGTLVVFGTGRYIDTGDNSTTQVQTLYGIWDKFDNNTVSSSDRSNLQAQTVTTTSVQANTTTVSGGTTTTTSHDYRTVSENTPNWSTKKGWYVNFPDTGERIIYNPVIRGGAVLSLTTAVPSSDICKEGGDHWDYYLNVLTGGRLTWSVFVDLPGLQNFGFQAFASARKSSGISPSPTGIGSGKGLETRFGDKDIYKTNLGAAGSGRIAWREILND